MTERKPMSPEHRVIAWALVMMVSIPLLVVIGLSIWQQSWWPVLIFLSIFLGAGFLKRLTMGGSAPGSRRKR